MITLFPEVWLAYFWLTQKWPQYYNTEMPNSEIHEHCVIAALLMTESLLPSSCVALHLLYLSIEACLIALLINQLVEVIRLLSQIQSYSPEYHSFPYQNQISYHRSYYFNTG